MPTSEITSRHRFDRRSLLPAGRVMPQRGMPPASAETPKPVAALGQSRLRMPTRAAVFDSDAAPTMDFSARLRRPDAEPGKRAKDIATSQIGQDVKRNIRESELGSCGGDLDSAPK